MLCDAGMEEVKVCRGSKELFRGTVPSGYTMHLTIGDAVLVRKNKQWLSKCDVMLYRGVPCLRFGRRHDKIGKYIKLVEETSNER